MGAALEDRLRNLSVRVNPFCPPKKIIPIGASKVVCAYQTADKCPASAASGATRRVRPASPAGQRATRAAATSCRRRCPPTSCGSSSRRRCRTRRRAGSCRLAAARTSASKPSLQAGTLPKRFATVRYSSPCPASVFRFIIPRLPCLFISFPTLHFPLAAADK